MQKYYKLFLLTTLISCKNTNNAIFSKKEVVEKVYENQHKGKHKASKIVEIELPIGYERSNENDNSFGSYLRNISLKNDKTVYLYNGEKKINQNAQFAILDISVGKKDLQQCADAVMRLRAEYLFMQKRYDEIIFYDNEKVKYQFKEPYERNNFYLYLQKVFGMCGSASLAMQLKPKKDLTKIEIGDVFIRGGFPGHAVIVIDVAKNEQNDKIFMIAQSYMPAQDIHILINTNNEDISPWYSVNEIGEYIFTPEYTFTKNELKTW